VGKYSVLCSMTTECRRSVGASHTREGLMKEDLLDIRSGIKAGRYVNGATVSQGIVQRLLNALSSGKRLRESLRRAQFNSLCFLPRHCSLAAL